MMNENMITSNNIYVLPAGKTVNDVAVNLKRFLMNEENMEVQILKLENGSCFVQARSRGGKLKQVAGLDKVTSVKLTPVGDSSMVVEIGKGKWKDKVWGGALAWFVAWPFAVTTAIGAYRQGTLPRKVIENIAGFLVF